MHSSMRQHKNSGRNKRRGRRGAKGRSSESRRLQVEMADFERFILECHQRDQIPEKNIRRIKSLMKTESADDALQELVSHYDPYHVLEECFKTESGYLGTALVDSIKDREWIGKTESLHPPDAIEIVLKHCKIPIRIVPNGAFQAIRRVRERCNNREVNPLIMSTEELKTGITVICGDLERVLRQMFFFYFQFLNADDLMRPFVQERKTLYFGKVIDGLRRIEIRLFVAAITGVQKQLDEAKQKVEDANRVRGQRLNERALAENEVEKAENEMALAENEVAEAESVHRSCPENERENKARLEAALDLAQSVKARCKVTLDLAQSVLREAKSTYEKADSGFLEAQSEYGLALKEYNDIQKKRGKCSPHELGQFNEEVRERFTDRFSRDKFLGEEWYPILFMISALRAISVNHPITSDQWREKAKGIKDVITYLEQKNDQELLNWVKEIHQIDPKEKPQSFYSTALSIVRKIVPQFLDEIESRKLVPKTIAMRREITDDYGRRYIHAFSDDTELDRDKGFYILTKETFVPRKLYLYWSRTNPDGIDPLIYEMPGI